MFCNESVLILFLRLQNGNFSTERIFQNGH